MAFSPCFLAIVAIAIGFLIPLLSNLRSRQHNKKETKPSSSPSPPISVDSVPSTSLSPIWTHHVFPSFRGEDVRRDFLSHIHMEFQRMGITPFIDNEIQRGESIAPELIRVIRGSKIAIILLSRNYASSKWCLEELVEIMNCREELGQTVMAIFYRVDPSDVKKLTGDFGKAFKRTCAGTTKEDVRRWRQALAKVATIAGYHSDNWDNEAAMIKKISTDISNKLNYSSSLSDFNGLIGMRAHLGKIEPFLCQESEEVRMIGIWGPPGIGKTTIARVAYNKHCSSFQLSVFMENIKAIYIRPCSDDYSAKLQLQQQFMSRITSQKDMELTHLGVVQDRLKDKKVLVVLDGVDHLVQLDAMVKETWWFGPGSRIIITTQDQKLLRAHGIDHVYEVDYPPTDEAIQILCMHAFGQNSPRDGFEELVREVTTLAGKLPLGLRVMGSYFRGMSKQEWTKSLPRLRTSLDANIQSVLKFSYDALDDEDKDLFLHIACFFNHVEITRVEEHLSKKFLEVRQRFNVLAEKSLISINSGSFIEMHSLLEQLGMDIVRKQFIHNPGKRRFLVDRKEICEILTDDAYGSRNVIGINIYFSGIEDILDINERAFERMSNLQFLRVHGYRERVNLPRGLNYISRKLQLLEWRYFPLTCLTSIVNVDFLVELNMPHSSLDKLWEGIRPLRNLKWMNLSYSKNLMELPDLSTATSLEELDLSDCSSLVKLPSTIGYASNLQRLNLCNCSRLIKLPSSIGNATKLEKLYLGGCSSLVELPSTIENLDDLDLSNCSSLVEIPSAIGNATNLEDLDLSNCLNLVELPRSIVNLKRLQKLRLGGCSKLEAISDNINLESLEELDLTDCSMLKSFPEISTDIIARKLGRSATEEVPHLMKSLPCLDESPHDFEMQKLPPVINRISLLNKLWFRGCKKLVSLPRIPDSVSYLDAEGCESLERLDWSFHNPKMYLNFAKCLKLNQEARNLIIQRHNSRYAVVPGREVPSYFTHRATSGDCSLTVKLNEKPLPTSMKFQACILLVNIGDEEKHLPSVLAVTCKKRMYNLHPVLREHLYIVEVEAEVTSSELIIEFEVINRNNWMIRECGLLQLLP